jgi:hypothetical protein
MQKRKCPKCGRTLPGYMFGMRKQKRYIKKEGIWRTYYHFQSYCYSCRHPTAHWLEQIKKLQSERDENE